MTYHHLGDTGLTFGPHAVIVLTQRRS